MPGVAQLPTPPAGCRDVNGVCGLEKLVVRASFCKRLHSVNLRTFRAGRSGQSVPEHIGVAGLSQQPHRNKGGELLYAIRLKTGSACG